jgi:hypothetical protein
MIAKRRESTPQLFSSAKTVVPIPIVDALTHDRLVHLALDCDVLAIDIAELRTGRSLPVRVIVAQRPSGLYAQDIEAVRADPSHAAVEALHHAMRSSGLMIETVSLRAIRAEPRFGGEQEIWAQRHLRVDPGTRFAVLRALAEGPMRAGDLCDLMIGPLNPVNAIASLACSGVLHLDLSRGFSPATTVHSNFD